MAFPEGLPEKKEKLLRPDVRQPKIAYSADELAAGPGAQPGETTASPQRSGRSPRPRQVSASSRNVHGLRSKSEQMYPEAYAPVDASFWEGLSTSQQSELMRLQAVAQEKVGYERGTTKYFIDDHDPREVSRQDSGARLVSITAPRFIIAGSMLGAGLTLGLGLLFDIISGTDYLATCLLLGLVGSATAAFGSN